MPFIWKDCSFKLFLSQHICQKDLCQINMILKHIHHSPDLLCRMIFHIHAKITSVKLSSKTISTSQSFLHGYFCKMVLDLVQVTQLSLSSSDAELCSAALVSALTTPCPMFRCQQHSSGTAMSWWQLQKMVTDWLLSISDSIPTKEISLY